MFNDAMVSTKKGGGGGGGGIVESDSFVLLKIEMNKNNCFYTH